MVRERDERVELEYLAASDDDSGVDDEDNRMLVQLIDLMMMVLLRVWLREDRGKEEERNQPIKMEGQ